MAARLALLVLRPLWYDEIFTIWAARASVRALMTALSFDSGPPLFYLLEKPFVLLGEGASSAGVAARFLPFVAAALLFVASTTLSTRASRGRLLVLLAASPLVTVYAAEARAYAPLALGGLALFLLACRGQETRGRLALAAAAAAILLYIHYLAVFVVIAVAASAFVLSRRRAGLAALSGFLPFAFWLPTLAAQPAEAVSWMREGVPSSLLAFVSAWGGAGRVPNPQGGPLPTLLFGLGAAAGLFALFAAARQAEPETRAALLTGALTLLLASGVSLVRPVAFPGRTEMAVLPIWLWALARSGDTSALARKAAAAVVAIGAVSSLILLTAPRPEPEYAFAVRKLSGLAARGDLVVAGGVCYLPALLERERGRLEADLAGLPQGLEQHPGWFDPKPPGPAEIARVEQRLRSVPGGHHALVLLPAPLLTPALASVLDARGHTTLLWQGETLLLLNWVPHQP